MKKRFKTRNPSLFKLEIIILLTLIIFISFIITVKLLFNRELKTKLSNETFMNYLILHHLSTENTASSLNNIFNISLKQPSSILRYSLNDLVTFKELHTDIESPGNTSEYIEDPNPSNVSKPLVYIYNSHQTESYDAKALADYNIEPNVLMASYLLREKLMDLGVPTIVETTDINAILTTNNWPYYRSYDATRPLVEQAKKDYPSLKLFIDLHRDSSDYDKTTYVKSTITYAKVLFVVGKEHENYSENLELANTLNDKIKTLNANLSRGIYLKEGPGVNGIYNQDISPNSVLIELGGQYNTIEEASNTINLLAQVINEYLKEEN